jgi:hypothetical protein
MKNFLLTTHPNFGETSVTVDGYVYKLCQVKGNGLYLSISGEKDGIERDMVTFTKSDLKALFLLLSTEK